MREISFNQPDNKLPVFTFLPYGVTRAGKTHWAATLPRPLIIADVAESGYKTILSMDRSTWFEPDVEPIIVGVDQMNDVATLMQPDGRIDQLARTGRIKSVVFDAFTYYCDQYLAYLARLDTKDDNRKVYGNLGKHLRELRVITGSKGLNVAYCCLEESPSAEDGTPGRPQIPGNQGGKFAGGVDFLWRAKFRNIVEAGKVVGVVREMRTKPEGAWIAGNRLGARADLLPDPFTGTYSDLLTLLGYDVELLRKSLPAIGSIKSVPVTQPIAPKQPPIVATKPTAPVVVTKPAAPVVTQRPAAPVAVKPTSPAPRVVSPQANNNPASRGATK